MINTLLRWVVKGLLALRYRVRVRGLEPILQRGRRGILFLPNHPGLIDPFIVVASLHREFAPRALADKDQIDRFFIRWLAARMGARPILDIAKHGAAAREQIAQTVQDCIAGLRAGENLVLYPSGHLYRTRFEDLRGNSAVETILRDAPEIRVVLVRSRGLWGSSFSMASGRAPRVGEVLRKAIFSLLSSFVFFAPKREVTVELFEPADLPRSATRNDLNDYLERYYNENAPPNTYVPYTTWERGGPRELPDPPALALSGDIDSVPAATRQHVYAHLKKIAGVDSVQDADQLATDLGMDSLSRAELVVWLGEEFGFHAADVTALQTVADVVLAATGQSTGPRTAELQPVPGAWFSDVPMGPAAIPPGETINEVFLEAARGHARRPIVADQLSGVRTYRDLITAIYVLKPQVEAAPGERVGILLPASVAASSVFVAALFAGKTPVMVNWTTGSRNIKHALDLCGVQRVFTAGPLVARIESQGTDLSAVKERFVYLEQITAKLSRATKLAALLRAMLSWGALRRAKPNDVAVILLTSGSEALPKAVPLTHGNILSNLRDVVQVFPLTAKDRLFGFLPPFHSFGITITLLLPLCTRIRTVYHANPTESLVLARMIEAYRPTLLVGTPTFLAGIMRASSGDQLRSLRLAVTGAEKCPERVYQMVAERCPGATILEGYGITECSPVVAASRPEILKHGTIGRVLPSLEYAIVDVESWRPAERGANGMLLVRGPSVFGGYLGNAESPFVEFDGRQWYKTGDLVSEDEQGVLTFRGRLKRFVKLGGEMISLPAIESVLSQHLSSESDDGPILAVESTANESHPEIVLFTTREIDRAGANRLIRGAQLSPLHNISRVIRVDEIPVLGTGKADYRALKARLASEQGAG